MSKMDNTDFETGNIETIRFWMMDPFLDPENPNYEGGDLYINLGEISKDEFKGFIGSDIRLDRVVLRKEDLVNKLLEYYMGKNTMERQSFIVDNLVVEDDTELL
jgi:hypothetical protein